MSLIYDAHNPRAVMVHAFLEASLDPAALDPRLHVVIGGDGFMLRAVREHFRPEAVFLGLNCGRLGFLLNEIPADMALLPGLIASDKLRIMTFPRIAMEAVDLYGNVLHSNALNDIYLERMTGQTCHLNIRINGMDVVQELVCDGLILSTALGSTAYNFSAGGAVCHPSLEIICVTPICPHSPRLSPLVFPLRATVVAQVLSKERRRVRAVADGVDHNEIVSMTVSDAASPVKLAFFPSHDFTGTLVRKVLNT